jgi:transcriptional regulator with XRE-family HTH domain
MATFDDFMAELEAEARAEGPEALAELEAFRLHFSLARQLAAQRRALHLTQKQLAEMTGIDQAEISRIERGQANPTTATLGTLTRALGVDVRLVPAASPKPLPSNPMPPTPPRGVIAIEIRDATKRR